VGYEQAEPFGRLRAGGQPRRKLDTSRAKVYFGFEARAMFVVGLRQMIEWYREQVADK
jgi:nucleoside-diphosphate-sugar epimerase